MFIPFFLMFFPVAFQQSWQLALGPTVAFKTRPLGIPFEEKELRALWFRLSAGCSVLFQFRVRARCDAIACVRASRFLEKMRGENLSEVSKGRLVELFLNSIIRFVLFFYITTEHSGRKARF